MLSALQQDAVWKHIYEWHSITIILALFLITLSAKNTWFLDIFLEKNPWVFSSFQPFSPEAQIQVLLGTALPYEEVQNNPNPTLITGNWNEKDLLLKLKAVWFCIYLPAITSS